jgi:periplasmic copper chaperone A
MKPLRHRPSQLLRTTVMIAAIALAIAACGGGGPGLTVADPWVRYTGPDVPAGGFMTLTNAGGQDDALVSASSPAFGSVELHETVEGDDGMMAMQPVTSILIPAGGTTKLEPGSYHMMLFDPTGTIEIGQTVDITLTFEQGGTKDVSAVVQAP